MKLILIKQHKFVTMSLVVFLVSLLLIYTISCNQGILDVFLNNSKELPIYSVETEDKKIAISFDAAWGSDKTEDLLATLKKYNVKTTFFLVGFWVDKYPEMVKRIHEEGHEIGNHSSTHPKMSQLSEEQIEKELTDTSSRIEQITGQKVTLLRPPFGEYTSRIHEAPIENRAFFILPAQVQ